MVRAEVGLRAAKLLSWPTNVNHLLAGPRTQLLNTDAERIERYQHCDAMVEEKSARGFNFHETRARSCIFLR